MTEISHARARIASVGGLLVQVLAFAAFLALALYTNSQATWQLAWYTLGGTLIWLAALLVLRQRELVVIEQRDLEQLRREKQAVGGLGVFDDEGGVGIGFRVAEARLKWMQRWLVPIFSLITAAYLVAGGGLLWKRVSVLPPDSLQWPPTQQTGMALVVTAFVMFALFLYSRYASGLGRTPEWQILRGAGSYMLGNTLAAFALIITLGLELYADIRWWEHILAYVIPAVMVVLGLETAANFVLDIYRPRMPGVEPRAAFDSRLLGLISEPGGIAHTIAEAINYQFGFQVSQTWFYQLLERTFVPLAGVAVIVLWLLTTIVIVRPYELAVIEKFGRQVNADTPLGPGIHFKVPWPFAIAHKYSTGQLHQIVIGYKVDGAGEKEAHEDKSVVLWTDTEERGKEHFNLIVMPTPGIAREAAPTEAAAATPAETPPSVAPAVAAQPPPGETATVRGDVPIHILRMSFVLQYMIDPARVARYMNAIAATPGRNDAADLIRDVAWQELLRYNATHHVDGMLGTEGRRIGEILAERIGRRLDALDMGIKVVYAGLQGVHPETSVAKAFEKVIVAEQEKITKIREAQVKENQILSAVAGGRGKAIALAEAIEFRNRYEDAAARAQQSLSGETPEQLRGQLDNLKPLIAARIEAEWNSSAAKEGLSEARQQFELGLGNTTADVQAAEKRLAEAREAEKQAAGQLDEALKGLKTAAGANAQVDAAIEHAVAAVGVEFWTARLESHFRGLEGEAAKILAQSQAERWRLENKAAAELARFENERLAYAAAPRLYESRRYMEVLSNGLAQARKYFLAFDPGQRSVKLRIEAQETAVQDMSRIPTRKEP